MHDRTRRRIVQWLGAGMAVPTLAGCAVNQTSNPGHANAASDQTSVRPGLELLYFADTLDTRSARLPAVPRLRLGPPVWQGQAPWLTGQAARRSLAGTGTDARVIDWLDSGGGAPAGGYACLAALLAQLRRQAEARGAQTLTLENGQCWNGSGLAYLTRGGSGVQGSQLLGSEIRVSSDERTLWPEQASHLYEQARLAGVQTLAGALADEQRQSLAVEPYRLLQRGGLQVAVVSATDPYALDERRPLQAWFETLRRQVLAARSRAELVVLLADIGTGPALWLSQRLEGVDLILAARGQSLWPQLVGEPGRPPVCLPGAGGCGLFHLRMERAGGRWHFQADFIPALVESLDAAAREQLPELQQRLDRQRALHADWLDQPLARAPVDLRHCHLFAGSWDQLIHDALKQDHAGTVVLPGWRHEVPVAAGEWIRREHLLMLSASAEARLSEFETDVAGLQALLEQSAEQLLGQPLLLDTSDDLPRMLDFEYRLDYGRGRRIQGLQPVHRPEASLRDERLHCRTLARGNGGAGEPLWQRLEQYLRGRPDGWTLASPSRPAVQFVEGHPGWSA